MLKRVDHADAEQVVDETARARAPDGAADAGVPDLVRDVGHREEVGGHAGLRDDVKLVIEAFAGVLRGPQAADAARAADGARCPVTALQDCVLAAVLQRFELVVRGASNHGAFGLWQVPGADAEVAGRVEDAPPGEFLGFAEQQGGGAGRARACHRRCDAFGGGRHVFLAGEVGAAVVRDEPGRAERYEAPRGVEHLDGQAVDRVQVANGVREHGRGPGVAGEFGEPGGAERRLAFQVIDDLDDGVHAEVPPAVEDAPGQVGTASGDRPPDVTGRAEQHDQAGRVLGDQLTGGCGNVVVGCSAPAGPCSLMHWRCMRGGHETAQRGPPLTANREQRNPAGQVAPAVGGVVPAVPGVPGVPGAQRQIDAEQGPDPGIGTGPDVLERTVEAIAVGQRER